MISLEDFLYLFGNSSLKITILDGGTYNVLFQGTVSEFKHDSDIDGRLWEVTDVFVSAEAYTPEMTLYVKQIHYSENINDIFYKENL